MGRLHCLDIKCSLTIATSHYGDDTTLPPQVIFNNRNRPGLGILSYRGAKAHLSRSLFGVELRPFVTSVKYQCCLLDCGSWLPLSQKAVLVNAAKDVVTCAFASALSLMQRLAIVMHIQGLNI